MSRVPPPPLPPPPPPLRVSRFGKLLRGFWSKVIVTTGVLGMIIGIYFPLRDEYDHTFPEIHLVSTTINSTTSPSFTVRNPDDDFFDMTDITIICSMYGYFPVSTIWLPDVLPPGKSLDYHCGPRDVWRSGVMPNCMTDLPANCLNTKWYAQMQIDIIYRTRSILHDFQRRSDPYVFSCEETPESIIQCGEGEKLPSWPWPHY